MRLSRYFVFLFAVLSMNSMASVLDLKDVIRIAKEKNPRILAAKEKLNQYDSQKYLAASSLYPSLNWILNGNYQKDAVYTGSPKFGGDPYNTYGSDLKLTQTLYGKGLISAVRSSDYDKKIQQTNIEIEERNITQNIIEAFYRFILNQQALENLLKNQDIIQKSLATSQSRYEKGRGQMLDILQVKTQLALIQPQIEQAKNQYTVAAQQLIAFMGEKEHPELKIKGALKTLRLKEVQKLIDLSTFRLPEYELNQLQLTQLDYNRDVILGKHFPNIKLVGDYLYNNYKKADLFSDFSNAWAISLQLTIPLFSGFSSNQERAIIASQDSQLRIARRDLENSLTLKQVSSLQELETVEASLLSSESAVKLAEQTQDEGSRLYRLSQIDFLQFLTVQQSALQARNNLDKLKYQSIVSYSNYFVSSGQSLDKLVDFLTREGDR